MQTNAKKRGRPRKAQAPQSKFEWLKARPTAYWVLKRIAAHPIIW